jgi:hypothetical protein
VQITKLAGKTCKPLKNMVGANGLELLTLSVKITGHFSTTINNLPNLTEIFLTKNGPI